MLRETYYLKFNEEHKRAEFINKFSTNPYYLSHYKYERDADIVGYTEVQYMLSVNIGNFVPGLTPVTGEHRPLPILASDEEEEASHG